VGNEVRVDERSVLARFADWHAQLKQRPVGAFGPQTQESTLFIENEVLVDGADEDLIHQLGEQHGAELVVEAPLPERPELLRGNREVDLTGIPALARLRFDRPPEVGDRTELLTRAAEELREAEGGVVVSSELGASVAALAVRHGLEGRSIGLDLLGKPFAMPLSTATESAIPRVGSNPFSWAAFSGSTRIVDAWQLTDSVRKIRGNRLVTIGILDAGFWLDGRGVPNIPAGQAASDFGAQFIQLNLQDESKPAGGGNPNGSTWHGNAVASTAAAAVNNSLGAAGSGGTVATPMFFQTDYSITQTLRCVKICAAWGIDVLNMSFGFWGHPETFFSNGIWDRNFQFAFDNGVVMVAASGNFGIELPEDDMHIRPATRTPGVLTVGSIDPSDNAVSTSDYGSSVWLWAPGTNIPVAPDQNSPAGSLVSGTSFASPMVAGVAAMMRYVNGGMSAPDIQRALIDTGRPGQGRVSRTLDAFAAVFSAAHGVLPDTDEPNNTPGTARDLLPIGPGGILTGGTGGFSTRSSNIDPDYWRFTVDRFSTVMISVDWYQRLGNLYVAVEAEDPAAVGPDQMTSSGGPNSGQTLLSGLLPPGRYRIRIGGSGVTAYRLFVSRTPSPLPADIFEANDSFEQAARLLFESGRWTVFGVRSFPPGSYDATLHQERGLTPLGQPVQLMNDDYYRLEVPGGVNISRPTVSVYDADSPLDVVLYDNAQAVIQEWTGVRHMKAYPPRPSTCFLKVSGTLPTRYRIHARMTVDPALVPDLEVEVDYLPKWWGDPPPFRLQDAVTHFVLPLEDDPQDGLVVAFDRPEEELLIELVSTDGEVLRQAEAADSRLFLDTGGLDGGTYLVRVSRAAASAAPVELRTAPPLL
jgi:hypothetical protein